jgi:hypothetical protein
MNNGINFYKKRQIKTSSILSKTENSVLFLNYLAYYISYSASKRDKGYRTMGLAHNSIRTYKSFFRIVKAYEFMKSTKLYVNITDKYTARSFIYFLKIEQQYPDNYCGQLLKLLKIILCDAERSGLKTHPYSNYLKFFKPKSSDRILPVLNPKEIKALKGLKHIPAAYTDCHNWLLISLYIG